MDQRKYDENPLTRTEIIIISLFAVGFLFMLSMEMLSNYQPRKLGALFFILFWIPLLFIHEFGHALMAKFLGWEVKQIQIGFGYTLFKGKIFGSPLEIRAIPLEGFVNCQPKVKDNVTIQQAYNRYQEALIYFAGPAVELFIFFAIMAYFGSNWMFSMTDNYFHIAVQAFSFAALAGAVMNLIPVGITTKEGTIPNDGLGILTCLFGRKK
ncbi:MAG: M50 family metallopeptidase [Thiotrichaceae bacterium]|nr:M50 family metallopeptidase [Thiotrichaceae bacterium]